MSIYSIRQRWGMGPRVDPHFDAHVGRTAARLRDGKNGPRSVPGYVELDGERPWLVLQALLAVLYDAPPEPAMLSRALAAVGLQAPPPTWSHVREIRYLTTDAGCGVALPMHDFMPPPGQAGDLAERRAALKKQIDRLDALTRGRLRKALSIGLTVSFDLEIVAGGLEPMFGRERLEGGRAWADDLVLRVLFGGMLPGLRLRALSGLVGSAPFHSQKLGLAGGLRPQLANAMRLLQTPPLPAAGPLHYGMAETGRGTIVGIVDFGCDFAHPSFRTGAQLGGSRILALWDQNGTGAAPVVQVNGQGLNFGYGRLIARQDIEAVLAQCQADPSQDPYALLRYDPHQNHYTAKAPGSPGGPLGAHGTFVMEAAAGGRRAVGVAAGAPAPSGVAPDADVVFVHVRLQVTADGRRILDMNDVVDAVAFIFHVAEQANLPCAVNLSLNTMNGPHDGDGYFERRLASLLRSGSAGPHAEGRAVVVAAGNLPDSSVQALRWQHLIDDVAGGAPVAFHWCMASQDPTRNFVEIWYDATDALLQVTLVSPEGEVLGPVAPGEAAELMEGAEWRGTVIGSRPASEAETGFVPAADGAAVRHVILLQLEGPAEGPAEWQVRVELAPNAPAGASVRFDAWLERDDEGPSGLSRDSPPTQAVHPRDFRCTVGTLSCGHDPIVVGAYSTFSSRPSAWGLSGHGPSRRGDIFKPDIAAPGHFVTLVRSRQAFLPGPLTYVTGTSVAAPFVTGTIACVYQRDPKATLAQVRAALIQAARPLPGAAIVPTPGAPATWSPDLGHGCLDPAAVLALFP